MTVDWSSYEVFNPGIEGLPENHSRKAARLAYQRLMDAKPRRIEILSRLLKCDGIDLRNTDSSIQQVNDWFRGNVSPNIGAPERLLPEWYSVVNDLSLFLGDVMIERSPILYWEFYIWGKKNVSYHRHVIMGFATEDPKYHTCLDIDRALAVYGHRVVSRETVDSDEFLQWLEIAERRAGTRPD
ncbi:hypothetical protein GCM10009765_11150 [Fodinicola feengrottensis]|uniref:Uncharacterized protein n=1 Tax=Fodinicola feengrottensis TaxID=435914 RepID=A0ABP4RWR8_9ACTN